MKPIIYKELKVGDKVVTRCGWDGEVIYLNKGNRHPIVCAITDTDGRVHIREYVKTGEYNYKHDRQESNMDIFIPSKKETVYLYRNEEGFYIATTYQYDSVIEDNKTFRLVGQTEVEL